MRTQINRENAGFNTTNFLKWIMQNPNKKSTYLKCKLKEIVIEVNEDDILALIGNDNNEIFLDYFEYEDISDFISMDELIENNILEEPLFVVIAECAYEWEYGTNTQITGITDDYTLAQTIAKNTNGNIELAQKNKPISIQAGCYIE